MPKKKRERILALKNFSNVTETPTELKERWHKDVFSKAQPIHIELGCGKGDFLVEMARRQSRTNFIGVDIKGARIFIGAQQGLDEQLTNLFFVRYEILDLDEVFKENDISEAWITFPDPYPKKPRKRMTHQRFIEMYRRIMEPQASIHFKTDDEALYEYSLKSLAENNCNIITQTADLYGDIIPDERLSVQTTFERRHIAAGKTIKYIHFRLEEKIGGVTNSSTLNKKK